MLSLNYHGGLTSGTTSDPENEQAAAQVEQCIPFYVSQPPDCAGNHSPPHTLHPLLLRISTTSQTLTDPIVITYYSEKSVYYIRLFKISTSCHLYIHRLKNFLYLVLLMADGLLQCIKLNQSHVD